MVKALTGPGPDRRSRQRKKRSDETRGAFRVMFGKISRWKKPKSLAVKPPIETAWDETRWRDFWGEHHWTHDEDSEADTCQRPDASYDGPDFSHEL